MLQSNQWRRKDVFAGEENEFQSVPYILGGSGSSASVIFSGVRHKHRRQSGNPQATPQSGMVNMMVSDASTEDWATIGVKILSISLVPQGGGAPVNIFTAGSTVPMINLVELDQLGELLGTMSVPAGTYTAANLTISANSGDVSLVVAADPETGFARNARSYHSCKSDSDYRGDWLGWRQNSSGECCIQFATQRRGKSNGFARCGIRSRPSPPFLVGHVPPPPAAQPRLGASNSTKAPCITIR